MRVIIIGDTHIDEGSIPELKAIFEEVFQQKGDMFIHLGDFFDKCRPTPAELKFGAEVVFRAKKLYKKVVILSGTGRHNWLNDVSIIEFFKYMGITPKGVSFDTEIDGKKCLFGHFFTNQSKLEYGTAKITVKKLKEKYDIVLLGHQHQPQKITKTIYHLGSMRHVGWNEVGDVKMYAIIEDGEIQQKMVQSAIHMRDVWSPEDLPNIDPNTKVRLLIHKWEDYKKWVNDFPKWEKRFQQFKVKTEYQTVATICKGAKEHLTSSLKDFVAQWLTKIKEKEVLTFLKKRFNEEGL